MWFKSWRWRSGLSSRAKKLVAALRISTVCCSSRFLRRSSRISLAASLDTPGAWPSSIWASQHGVRADEVSWGQSGRTRTDFSGDRCRHLPAPGVPGAHPAATRRAGRTARRGSVRPCGGQRPRWRRGGLCPKYRLSNSALCARAPPRYRGRAESCAGRERCGRRGGLHRRRRGARAPLAADTRRPLGRMALCRRHRASGGHVRRRPT
jgi:hypothetical protein